MINKIAEDADILGYYCGQSATIYLNNVLKGHKLQEVLLHELLHATFDIGGLGKLFNSKQEEAVCNAIESWAHLS